MCHLFWVLVRPEHSKSVSIALSLLWVSLAHSQTISGFVRDAASGEPLSYANVFIKETFLGSATDVDGYYVITDVPPGDHEVAASIIGYQMETVAVSLGMGENARVDFRLTITVIPGEEINVTAERQRFKEMVEVSTVTLGMREIQIAPAFVEADVFRTIQLLPGVQTLNDFSSALYVRGGTPDQNLIMLDGITVYNPFHLGGVFSTFNTDAIKEAEFHAGGFPARYGGRMGSILNIINREGNSQEYHGTANISFISGKALLEGPIPKLTGLKGSFMLAVRRTYFDTLTDLLVKVFRPRSEEQFVGFPYHFYDLEGKVNLDLSSDHRLTLSSFYGDDIVYFNFSEKNVYRDPESDYYEESYDEGLFDWRWGNFTHSATWRWIASPNLLVKTFLASSRFRFWIDLDAKDRGITREKGEEWKWRDEYYFDVFDIVGDATIETEVTWKPNSLHTVVGGFQNKALSFTLGMVFKRGFLDEGKFTTESDTSLWMENHPFERALYLQDKWHVTPHTSLQAGLRFSNYSLHDKLYLDPRIALKHLLNDNLSLKASWGRYHQFLSIANPQDENFRFIDIWLGLPADRPAPLSDHSVMGVEFLSPGNIMFRVEAYYKDFRNLITLKQGEMFFEEEDRIRFDPFNEFWDTDAFAYGLEFLARKTIGSVRGWIGYSFARTRWKTEVHGWYYPKFDRTHTLDLVGDWIWSESLHFSTAMTYSSGNPYTPVIGRYERWDESRFSPHFQWWLGEGFLVGKRNSARYPPYFRWDVSLIRRKPFLGGHRETYIQVINLTGHLNHLMYSYDMKTDQKTGKYIGVQRRGVPTFPFLVTLGMRFEF